MPKAQRVIVQATPMLPESYHTLPHYYRFFLPSVREKDFYRVTTSYNAFFHGNRRDGTTWNWSNKWLYSADKEIDSTGESAMMRVYLKLAAETDEHVKVTDCEGLYEFYKLIGWDRNVKCYIAMDEVVTKGGRLK